MAFESDIKPFFREQDRDEMLWAFDLWSYEDVRNHASEILERIDEGSMPCDQAWSIDRIEAFRVWIQEGTAR